MRWVEAAGLRLSVIRLGGGRSGRRRGTGGATGIRPRQERSAAAPSNFGVSLFDTAESYGDGESERLLGDMLSRSQARDSIVLATKVSPLGLTRERVRAAAQASLERARHRSYRPLPGFFLAAGVRSAMLAARGTDRRLHAAAGLLILAFILFALTDNPMIYTARLLDPARRHPWLVGRDLPTETRSRARAGRHTSPTGSGIDAVDAGATIRHSQQTVQSCPVAGRAADTGPGCGTVVARA
jgi:hypothetical protein